MIRAVVAAVVVLIFSATAALSFQDITSVEVAVDVVTTGNSATALGPEDACLSVNVGDSFDIDIVVKGVKPVLISDGVTTYQAEGLAGFGYNLHFDPSVVHVTAAENNFMLKPLAPYERIEANYTYGGDPNPLPATTGDIRVDYLDGSEDYETGDGVLSRLTLQALGPGTTTLHADSEVDEQPAPSIYMSGGFSYGISKLQDAVIKVGAPCDAASVPTPTDPADTFGQDQLPPPTPTPSPVSTGPVATTTLGPSDLPPGDTAVSVDAIPEGNAATQLGQINECATAKKGDTFQVDVVIQNVEDLLGWEALVTYDPSVLNIVDRNVKLFQAANSGSQVFDASNQTPNTTGFYRAGAVDQADPDSPDSGDGVLMRLTLEAVGDGTSKVSLAPQDLSGGGVADSGLLLKNVDAKAIGGQPFHGAINDAEIRVGSDCPDGGSVITTAAPTGGANGNGDGSDDSSNTWIWVVAGAVVVAVLAGGAAALVVRRRRTSGSSDGGGSSGTPT